MPENKIVDLTRYREEQKHKGSDHSNKSGQSFEEKLKAFLHPSPGKTGSINELITIFEDEQLKKDNENDEG